MVSDPVFVSFSDVRLARRVLEAIADDPALVVDDDDGRLLPGPEFVHMLREHPEGDWRCHDG